MINLNIPVPTYTDIIVKTLSEIDLLLKNYVFDGYSALSNFLRVPLGIIASIYLTIIGYSIMLGWLRLSTAEFTKIALKTGFIYMAVTEWSWVSQTFIKLINNSIDGLGDVLISASPVHIPGVDGINGAMQVVLIEFTKLGAIIFQSGGLSNFGGWLDGLVVWFFGYGLVGLALFELVVAKVMLAILFVFIPLIVLFCFFKPLQGVFDRWLGAIISAALLQLLVTAALTLALSLAYWWVDSHIEEQALQIGNYGTLPAVILGIICIGLVWKASELAYFLGAAIRSTSTSSFASGIIGGYVGATLLRKRNS